MVSIRKHAQNHDGRLKVATFLHPKKFFCHSNKMSHFGHVTIFWYHTACFKLHSARKVLQPYWFCGVVSTSIGCPFVKNTAEEWFCKLSHFRLDTLHLVVTYSHAMPRFYLFRYFLAMLNATESGKDRCVP